MNDITDTPTADNDTVAHWREAFEAMRQLYIGQIKRADEAEKHAEAQSERARKAVEGVMDYYTADRDTRFAKYEVEIAKLRAECERLRAALMEDNAD